jgi:hypothetical protein
VTGTRLSGPKVHIRSITVRSSVHNLKITHAPPLSLPCCLHSLPDGRRRLPQPIVGQLLVFNTGHLNVDVDPVQQRAGACPEHREGTGF